MFEAESKLLPRSQLSSPCQLYSDLEDDFDLYPPSGKRLAPVGAASNEDFDMDSTGNGLASAASFEASGLGNPNFSASDGLSHVLEERLRQMEEDQEELNTSLMSLTSHFAKVRISLSLGRGVKTPWFLCGHGGLLSEICDL